jgi:hypothetical protein
MWENMQLGLDIATALSVIGAAFAFIWNSTSSQKRELKERRKDMIKTNMWQTAQRVFNEQKELHTVLLKINEDLIQGKTQQDLTAFKFSLLDLIFVFKASIMPFDQAYGKGELIKLSEKYKNEMESYGMVVVRSTTQGSGEEFDFEEFQNITERHMSEFMKITEKYIADLD